MGVVFHLRRIGRLDPRSFAVGRDIGDGYDIAKRDFDGALITLAHVTRSVARNIATIKSTFLDRTFRNHEFPDVLIVDKGNTSELDRR
jgi:hypothetical protein